MSHLGIVMPIFCTSKEFTSYICLPPSVLRVASGGIGSQMEVMGIVLLGVTVGLPVICSGCLRDEVIHMGDVVDAIIVSTDILTFCLLSDLAVRLSSLVP